MAGLRLHPLMCLRCVLTLGRLNMGLNTETYVTATTDPFTGGITLNAAGVTTYGFLGAQAPTTVAFPTGTPTAVDGGSAGLPNGTYYYTCSFYTAFGETDITTAVPTPVTVVSRKIQVSAIPVSADSSVLGRRLYRNKAADGTSNSFPRQWLVADIADNTTTTYLDNIADASLVTPAKRVSDFSPKFTYGAIRAASFAGISLGIGDNCMPLNTGYANVGIGPNALRYITNGMRNVGVGVFALGQLTTGDQNTALGVHALNNAVTSTACTAVGYASQINSTGNNNTSVGDTSLNATSSGSHNTAIGQGSLAVNTADNNTAVGTKSAYLTTSGTQNTALGSSALNSNQTGNFNTGLGFQALYSAVSVNFNTAVGWSSLNVALGAGNVAIGAYSGRYETGSNSFYVNNQDFTNTATEKTNSLMYGVFAATPAGQTLRINAALKPLTSTVAALPSAATVGVGFKAMVTDATAPTFLATVAGGGAVVCPVFSDGTNWKVG